VKYILELEIDCPRERVVELYADPENWPAWQESLAGYEILSGSDRAEGMKTRLSNRFGSRVVEIVETVEANRLPDEMVCTYEAQGAWNRVANRFTVTVPDKTRWEFDTEFRCRGMLRVMGLLLPGMFRKASPKEMRAFKRFAESRAQSANYQSVN